MKPWHVFVAGFAGMACGAVLLFGLQRTQRREPANWWCSHNVCTRTVEECRNMVPITGERVTCDGSRIAYCPVDGNNILQCVRDLPLCEKRAAELVGGRGGIRCIGVE